MRSRNPIAWRATVGEKRASDAENLLESGRV